MVKNPKKFRKAAAGKRRTIVSAKAVDCGAGPGHTSEITAASAGGPVHCPPQRMNAFLAAVQETRPMGHLFDAFWREGELALLFGPHGAGKSVLAMQIAESIARGRSLGSFRMPSYRRKVLYVDLVHSEAQFRERYFAGYNGRTSEPRSYRFSESLFCVRVANADGLFEWLAETVRANRFQVVVIDDLSAVRRSADGTREALQLMRSLRRLREEFQISVLVLTGSKKPRTGLVTESDLGRSISLCDAVDSVFAIGPHPRFAGDSHLLQVRSRSAPMVWVERNAPICRIQRLDDGLLGFRFDRRFEPKIDPDTRSLIAKVRAMRVAGAGYRVIAEKLGISISRAYRLMKRSSEVGECGDETTLGEDTTEAVAAAEPDNFDEEDEWDEAEFEKPAWIDFEQSDASAGRSANAPQNVAAREISDDVKRLAGWGRWQGIDWWRSVDLRSIAFGGRRSILHLPRRLNDFGVEMFIEKDLDGVKAAVWYTVDNKGDIHRWVRSGGGPTGVRLGPAPYIDGWWPP